MHAIRSGEKFRTLYHYHLKQDGKCPHVWTFAKEFTKQYMSEVKKSILN